MIASENLSDFQKECERRLVGHAKIRGDSILNRSLEVEEEPDCNTLVLKTKYGITIWIYDSRNGDSRQLNTSCDEPKADFRRECWGYESKELLIQEGIHDLDKIYGYDPKRPESLTNVTSFENWPKFIALPASILLILLAIPVVAVISLLEDKSDKRACGD